MLVQLYASKFERFSGYYKGARGTIRCFLWAVATKGEGRGEGARSWGGCSSSIFVDRREKSVRLGKLEACEAKLILGMQACRDSRGPSSLGLAALAASNEARPLPCGLCPS